MSWEMPIEMQEDFENVWRRDDGSGLLDIGKYDENNLKIWIEHWFEKLVSKEVQKIIHNNKLV